ncbi:MAG TPA: Ig-like domain-containing protein [Saprospiraceae bacterium]|nr:Ig-like domain-containing protein [Saprospiraceae bacterium]
MKKGTTLIAFVLCLTAGTILAQNQITYGFVQDPVDQLKMTAVAYPNFTSNNVTISTALFTFYLPAGTVTDPSVPVLPATGNFTNITGTWRIEKITPDLYASFGYDPNDLQGNDVYQCILQNSPSPNTVNGQPVSLFSFRLPGDCTGGSVQVHVNDNAIHMALLNNVGININNQMSVSVNDDPSVDIYAGNNPATDDYDCPLDDVPVAVDDAFSTNEDTPLTANVTGNDSFGADGPSNSAITIVTGALHGTSTVDNNGTPNDPTDDKILYTPNANFNGLDTIIYQICDADNDCDQAIVVITVNAVNDPPSSPNTTATTPEDTPVDICSGISDVDNSSFTTTLLCAPDHGTVSGLTNPSTSQYCLTYTPDAHYSGPDTLCVLVCDGSGACDTSYVYITVTPVNDPPSSPNTTATTPEDTPVNICGNISDVDHNSFTTTLLCAPDHGTVTGLTNPSGAQYCLDYTPDANYNGPDTLCVLVCDGAGACDTSYVYITVTPVNDPPLAVDDNANTAEDTPVSFNITANDTDVDGMIDNASVDLDPNTPGIQTTLVVAGGTFTYTGGGSVTFTPNAGFNGTATAEYRVCDNGTPLPALCDLANINVTVDAVNDPPVANNDNATTPEDSPVSFNITTNDTDSDGMIDNGSVDLDPNTPGIQTTLVVAGGTFTYTGGGSVTFTPNANFNGFASAQYQVCDNGTPLPAQCDTATISVTVNAVNDPPLAVDDNANTAEDTPVSFNITANDTDVDGVIDNASVDLDPNTPGIQTTLVVAGGTFTYTGGGSVTFTPNAGFNGTATAEYRVCDNGTPLPALCDLANINVTVDAVNDPPLANPDYATTPEDSPVSFNLTANDTDTDGMIDNGSVDLDPNTPGIQTSLIVAGGTFNYTGGGSVTFTPNANFNGAVIAQYRVCDNGTPLPAQCDTALITVTVNAVNDPPVANNDNATTNEDTPVSVPVLNNDTDVDGTLNPASVVVTDAPENGTTSVDPLTGAITYTPDTDFVGNDTLVYTVCDNGTPVLCDNATVIITVNATSVRLLAKMQLQGALYGSPDSLMRDNLRSAARIPKKEPYTALNPDFMHVGGGGNEMVTDSATVFANYGSNSIVDWVFIELRSSSNPATVVQTRAALLQRDGDVVDVDGVSPLVFENTNPAMFYVAIRHRNHLGSMTANAIQMTNEGTAIDFRNTATPLWDDGTNLNGFEQVTINGKYALWAGNVNKNKSVVFAGQNNDKDPIFNQIDQAPGNIFQSQSYVYNGYHLGDVNMDAKAIFAGQTNDVDFIFNNVDSHPKNITRSQSYVIRQQLAE